LKRTQKIGKIYKKGRGRKRNSIMHLKGRSKMGVEFEEVRCCDPHQALWTHEGNLHSHNSMKKTIFHGRR